MPAPQTLPQAPQLSWSLEVSTQVTQRVRPPPQAPVVPELPPVLVAPVPVLLVVQKSPKQPVLAVILPLVPALAGAIPGVWEDVRPPLVLLPVLPVLIVPKVLPMVRDCVVWAPVVAATAVVVPL